MMMPSDYDKYWWYGPLLLGFLVLCALIFGFFSQSSKADYLRPYLDAHEHPAVKAVCQCGSEFCYVGGPYDGERHEKAKR